MLRPCDVYERTTLSSSQVHRLMAQGRFPLFVRLTPGTTGLPEYVLDAFLAERMAARCGLPPLGYRPPLPQWHFDMSRVPALSGIRLLRRIEVEARVALTKTPLYRLVAQGAFPGPVPLGPRAARWVAHEVDAWVRDPASCDWGAALLFERLAPLGASS